MKTLPGWKCRKRLNVGSSRTRALPPLARACDASHNGHCLLAEFQEATIRPSHTRRTHVTPCKSWRLGLPGPWPHRQPDPCPTLGGRPSELRGYLAEELLSSTPEQGRPHYRANNNGFPIRASAVKLGPRLTPTSTRSQSRRLPSHSMGAPGFSFPKTLVADTATTTNDGDGGTARKLFRPPPSRCLQCWTQACKQRRPQGRPSRPAPR